MPIRFIASLVLAAVCATTQAADPFTFTEGAGNVLQRYRVECHTAEAAEADVRLDNLPRLALEARLDLLNRAYEQLHFHSMPPEAAEQPTADERARLVEWVVSELRRKDKWGHRTNGDIHPRRGTTIGGVMVAKHYDSIGYRDSAAGFEAGCPHSSPSNFLIALQLVSLRWKRRIFGSMLQSPNHRMNQRIRGVALYVCTETRQPPRRVRPKCQSRRVLVRMPKRTAGTSPPMSHRRRFHSSFERSDHLPCRMPQPPQGSFPKAEGSLPPQEVLSSNLLQDRSIVPACYSYQLTRAESDSRKSHGISADSPAV